MERTDLKSGMVVKLRDWKDKFILIDDVFCSYERKNFLKIGNYDEKLNFKNDNKLDIVEVYKCKYPNLLKCLIEDKLESIWKRKEIDWRNVTFGTKVRCWSSREEKIEGKFLAHVDGHNLPFRIYADGCVYAGEHCELIEEPKEEVTFKCIDREMNLYCKWENKRCDKKCDSCGIKYVLQNYNVTRKEQ